MYVNMLPDNTVEVTTGHDISFKTLALSRVKPKTEEGLSEYVLNAIEEYQGRFLLFNTATRDLFLNNTINDFNKGKK